MLLSELWSDWYTYANMTVKVLCHIFPFVSRTVTSPSRLYANGEALGVLSDGKRAHSGFGFLLLLPPRFYLLLMSVVGIYLSVCSNCSSFPMLVCLNLAYAIPKTC